MLVSFHAPVTVNAPGYRRDPGGFLTAHKRERIAKPSRDLVEGLHPALRSLNPVHLIEDVSRHDPRRRVLTREIAFGLALAAFADR